MHRSAPALSPAPDIDDEEAEVPCKTPKRGRSSKHLSNDEKDLSINNNPAPRVLCPVHKTPRNQCSCLKNLYEDDEVCRLNASGHLEFGIVGRLRDTDSDLKIYWTLGEKVEEEEIDKDDDLTFSHVRLIDRKINVGDTIHVNQKKGDVLGVSWNCHLQILENGMSLLNIPCEDLQSLVPYQKFQKLVYNDWIGTLLNVKLEATLMFTSVRKTGVIDCSLLPYQCSDVYQGRKLNLTIEKYVNANLRLVDEDEIRSPEKLFENELVVESYVLFVGMTEVEVHWHGKLPNNSTNDPPPPNRLSKGTLKRHARLLGKMGDKDWETCDNANEQTYLYMAKDEDMVVHDGGGIEELLKRKYFPEDHMSPTTYNFTNVKDLQGGGKGNVICTNINYNVKVVRLSRMIRVKWMSGKVDVIPASTVTTKQSFDTPLFQLVQKPVMLENFSPDLYGVTLGRSQEDMVDVQWVQRDCCTKPSTLTTLELSPIPASSIEPHYLYGSIAAYEIVTRSGSCRVPDTMFSIGWVRRITPQGLVVVYSVDTANEHELYPMDIEPVGIKTNSPVSAFFSKSTNKLVSAHGLSFLRNAVKIFTRNLNIPNGSQYPDHFTLLENAPKSHRFYSNIFSVRSDSAWMRATKKDQHYLTTRMNYDYGTVWVKGFKDRLDLFSVLFAAPTGTPYEGALFIIDVQLPLTYPYNPPSMYVHTGLGRIHEGLQDLKVDLTISSPYSPYDLMQCVTALQRKLCNQQEPVGEPSGIKFSIDFQESEDNAKLILATLDHSFLSVLNPPRLWATEIVNYFLMSFPGRKKELERLLSSSCSEHSVNYPLTPVAGGLTQSILLRLARFEKLIDESTF